MGVNYGVTFVLHRQIGERRFNGVAKKKLEALQEFESRVNLGENVGLVQQM